MTCYKALVLVVSIIGICSLSLIAADDATDSKPVTTQLPESASALSPGHGAQVDYVLGPGDQISLIVPGLEDTYSTKVFRIDGSGDISLPLIGRVHASGTTSSLLEHELLVRLGPILKKPEVVVAISSFGSEPVSVLGSVRNPGIIQLQGRKTLFDVLSMSGGLQPDAGYLVQVSRSLERGTISLSSVQLDLKSRVSVASIKLRDILNAPKAGENIEIVPGDTISVPKAGIVYAVGSVNKPGGYTLSESESLSALQVLSLAQGLRPAAASSRARILRAVPGSTNRVETLVDLNRLMAGKTHDVQLHPEDILFVPGSNAKKAGLRTLDAIVSAATYSTVYLAR